MAERDIQHLKQILLDSASRLPFFSLIGLEVLDAEPGRSTTRLAFRPDLAQPAGVMHGGVIASLIDTGIAYALLPCEEVHVVLQRGGSLVSVDLRVKYLRPVSAGTITCEAKVTQMGRQISHADAVVTNEAGKEVARGDAIYMSVPKPQS